ncbi:2Fe-2S iron-sulfur cluster-binding protein [Niallia sp. XMNu-256]|uniref:2Fe-2S iron-sulfur cluster-binding protein n=1 Tax=Niallia sp. XMNu-256 TaxID=3082444 RepID=UPI0030D432DD
MFTIKITDQSDVQWNSNDIESVLDGARRNGVNIPYACKGGGCGMCKVKVEKGEFERGRCSVAVLPNEEREQGFILACKTYPKGNLEILLDTSKELIG